jgi:hypothetical protein
MEIKEVIDFLSEAKKHTYSIKDKYWLSKAIDTLYHMKECSCFNH